MMRLFHTQSTMMHKKRWSDNEPVLSQPGANLVNNQCFARRVREKKDYID